VPGFDRRRVVLIVNPFASRVTRQRLDGVQLALSAVAEVSTRITEAPGHAHELAAEAAETADAVVVFSGDGTYNEAINGAAGRLPYGFVPGGGASIFPRVLGLPRDPAAAAARIAGALAAGRSVPVGLGRINGRRFCFSAGVGLDAEVVRSVDARGRGADGRRPGDWAFAAAAVGLLARRRARFEPQLEVVGHGRAAFVLAGCGRPYTYAGPVPIRLSTGSGGLDFVAPVRVTPVTLPRLSFRLLRGSISGDPAVLAAHDLDAFEVRCDAPLPLQADGEDLGDVTEVLLESEPDALAVLL
jgi:diacylglycerol kinase family enzyme